MPDLPNLGNMIGSRTPGAPLEAGILSEYEMDLGLRAAAVAGPPGTPARLVRLHGGICYRYAYFSFTTIGGVPQLPAPPPPNANEVLLGWRIAGQAPGFTPAGDKMPVRMGAYLFVLLTPPQVAQDALATGRLSMDAGNADANAIVPADFDPGMLGATPTPQSNVIPPKISL